MLVNNVWCEKIELNINKRPFIIYLSYQSLLNVNNESNHLRLNSNNDTNNNDVLQLSLHKDYVADVHVIPLNSQNVSTSMPPLLTMLEVKSQFLFLSTLPIRSSIVLTGDTS